MTLPVNDAVPGAVRQLRQSLRAGGLAGAVAAYFRPEEDFAGLSFTCLGSNPRDAVTASDLLAVSLLDIAWRPEAVRQLLDTSAAMVSGLLCAIRSDIDLWEASDEDLAAVDPLWDALLRMPGVGTATASKLLARKRPRLCPVSDKVVIGAVGVPGWTWEALRAFLQDPAARAEIEALRPPSAAVVSVLRILDVAIWIRHSHSRAASRIRRDSGIPEPGHNRPVTPGAAAHAGGFLTIKAESLHRRSGHESTPWNRMPFYMSRLSPVGVRRFWRGDD